MVIRRKSKQKRNRSPKRRTSRSKVVSKRTSRRKKTSRRKSKKKTSRKRKSLRKKKSLRRKSIKGGDWFDRVSDCFGGKCPSRNATPDSDGTLDMTPEKWEELDGDGRKIWRANFMNIPEVKLEEEHVGDDAFDGDQYAGNWYDTIHSWLPSLDVARSRGPPRSRGPRHRRRDKESKGK